MISIEEYEARLVKNYGPSTEEWLANIDTDYRTILPLFEKALENGLAGFPIPTGPYTNLRLALNRLENENKGFRLDCMSNDQGRLWVAITV